LITLKSTFIKSAKDIQPPTKHVSRNDTKTEIMSMFGGFGRPQPSSAEKIAAAEQEMDLVTDMFNKYTAALLL
jgi:hypothetical protein